MKKSLLILAVLSLVLFSACDKSNNNPVTPKEAEKGIIVVNEGLFGQNNSTLTYYNPKDKSVAQQVYSAANNGSKLGDTANDMKILGDKGYIVVNQSNKIEVVSMKDFTSVGTIDFTDYGAPRFICLPNNNVAYVSTYGDNVVKLNPATLEVSKVIAVGFKPEDVLNFSDKIFVANSGWGSGSTVSVISMASDSVVKEIKVGTNPRFLVKDSKYIYAICSDNFFSPTGQKGIYKIDPSSLAVTDSLKLESSPGKATIAEGKLLVIVDKGVAEINLSTFTLENDSLIGAQRVNPLGLGIYSIAYDTQSRMIYLGNPKDYQQNGEVAIFDFSGNEKGRFETGINPGTIIIYEK